VNVRLASSTQAEPLLSEVAFARRTFDACHSSAYVFTFRVFATWAFGGRFRKVGSQLSWGLIRGSVERCSYAGEGAGVATALSPPP
jgi:hypothetical protein